MRVSACHCLSCKRRSGSAFSWNAHFEAAKVTAKGEARSWARISDEGRWATFHFCPTCGATVHYEIEARPGIVSVPAGGFADPHFPAPSVSVYGNRTCAWVSLPDDIEEY